MFIGLTSRSAPRSCDNSKSLHPTYPRMLRESQRVRDSDGYWTGFAARARVLIVNTNLDQRPTSVLSYTDPRWRGKTVIANPLFGTTTDQIAALFVLWGDDRARNFMQKLRDNGVKTSPSNGDSADLVARGESAFSLVD